VVVLIVEFCCTTILMPFFCFTVDIGGLTVMRILTIIGCILSVGAFLLMFLYFIENDVERRHHIVGVAAAIIWAIAGT